MLGQSHNSAWDNYVHKHPHATVYHLSGWKNVIKKSYGHKTYYLMAIKNNSKLVSSQADKAQTRNSNKVKSSNLHDGSSALSISGVLPLVHLKHFIFGNHLISIPFFDLGGILADNEEIEKALLEEAIELGQKLKVDNIELRQTDPLLWFESDYGHVLTRNTLHATRNVSFVTKSHKVRMLLELPESSEILMKSFKSKLRSQVKRPMKDGLASKIGGLELLDKFYSIFLTNMRDLGSPVHSKKLIYNVLKEFPEKAKIVAVYKGEEHLAASIIVGFKDTLENPWASSLRQFSSLNPNMLLYWTMLEYACDNGFKFFDFGRSSPGEGTLKFKEQWGSRPRPLHWHYITLNGTTISEGTDEKSKFDKAIQYWQKLPVPVTKVVGPMIRKHIGL